MAAVGLTYDEALDRCPEDITAACCNAEDNITISGMTIIIVKSWDMKWGIKHANIG